jgi:hypothetical protein
MYDILSKYPNGVSFDEFMGSMCRKWEVEISSISTWSLYRTAIFSYLIKGIEDKKIIMTIKNYQLHFISTEA